MSVFRVKNTLVRTVLVVGFAAGLSATLQGCFLAVGAAAGGGALMATDRRTLGAQTEDREIQVKALSQISQNLPDSAHVNVTVFNRRVLLAIMPASSFSSRTNDTYLETRVKTALIAEKNISANNFKVVAERGNVYLMGLVTMNEGNIGADVTSRVPGVVQVVKVFQYIQPQEAEAAAAAAATAPVAASQPEVAEPTVGAIPDSSVSARPLEQQAPAPVNSSTSVRPGNPKAVP